MRAFVRELAGRPVVSDGKKVRPDDRRGQHPKKGCGHHPGLLLLRYLCEQAIGNDGNPEEKRAVLMAAINAAKNSDVRALYGEAFKRWERSLSNAETATLATAGRMIVGLGTENVLETGIRLHHTYGAPMIPGSALKGLAAHYCDQVWGAGDLTFQKRNSGDDKAYADYLSGERKRPDNLSVYRLLFGNTDDGGCVIFEDAWIKPESLTGSLCMDVMTPHHPKWNNVKDPKPPTDFDSPTPVPFLSVSGDFFFAVRWCGPPIGKASEWTKRAMDLLLEALFEWGVGGKTSSGYGRFDREKFDQARAKQEAEKEQQRRDQEKAAQLAAMSDIERSIHEYLENHPNKLGTRYVLLLEELKKEGGRWTSEEDRKEVAKRIKEEMIAKKTWEKKGKDADRTSYIKGLLGE